MVWNGLLASVAIIILAVSQIVVSVNLRRVEKKFDRHVRGSLLIAGDLLFYAREIVTCLRGGRRG